MSRKHQFSFAVANRVIFKKGTVEAQPPDPLPQTFRFPGIRLYAVKFPRRFQRVRIQHVGREIDACHPIPVVCFAPLDKHPFFKIFQKPVFVFEPFEVPQYTLDFFAAQRNDRPVARPSA